MSTTLVLQERRRDRRQCRRYIAPSASEAVQSAVSKFQHLDSSTVAVLSALGGTALTVGALALRKRWKRIRNADGVPPRLLDNQGSIVGIVTRVGDGDGFRLYHTPGPFWRGPLKLRKVPTSAKDLKNETLSVRIAGVDAPELAHFGNPAQPHGKESLEWLTNTIQGKRVRVQVLRRDQYGRIVGIPFITRLILPDKPLPLMMLKDGQAVVYEAGGAEYGKWGLEGMKKVEDEARRARRGLWAAKKLELPSDYKRRVREGGEVQATKTKPKESWWEMIGRWLGGKT